MFKIAHILLKGCVHYFLFFQPFKNYEKCFLFHLKCSFRTQHIQMFVFRPPLLFSLSVIASEDDRT